ncbi:MAG: trypsin-like peptidase domain-containing protein [Oscillospiraceae bacterium]|nr:trypsin-like peptidase domain-containing protein [Oscillospiraceae bacterium]
MNDYNEYDNNNSAEPARVSGDGTNDTPETMTEQAAAARAENTVAAQPSAESADATEPTAAGPVSVPAQESVPDELDFPEHVAYSPAGYVSSEEAAAVPKTYAYGKQQPPKQKKTRKGGGKAAVVAACLVCAILGGIVGGAVPTLFGGTQTDEVVSTPQPTSAATSAQSVAATSTLTSGSGELSASEIYYNLAVNQVVGIRTEITYTNFFGQVSSSAVSGSGFIISEDGYILTNYHVIEDAVSGGYEVNVLLYDGTSYTASVVGYADENDVAVLKIDAAGLSAVTIGDSDSLQVGETVYAVGNPRGELEYTMTSGIVSATDRAITLSETSSTGTVTTKTINMFQIDAAVNNGNSGGPVYNSRGEVIGIVTAKYSSSEGLAFAIPINDAIELANALISNGYISKPYMGILKASTLDETYAQYYGTVPGVYFQGVEEGSAAEKAGLQVGDIIVGLGDVEISTSSDLLSAKNAYRPGDTTEIRVYRSGEYLTLTITFDEEPVASTTTTSENSSGSSAEDYYNRYNEFFASSPFGTR